MENLGARMVREVASKTSDVAGDGTTTATVLAQAIFREGIKSVTAGANPMELKKGIDTAVAAVVEELKKLSKPVKGKMIAQVGTISANNDEEIGRIIAEAMEKVGKDGVITVEESRTMETVLDVVEGMRFDRGYSSPYFVTDPERMEVVLENPYILIFEKKISSMKDLLPVLEKIAQQGAPLLIIAEDVEGEALATLVVNKLRGHAQGGRGQGPGLRRPPQGHARGHRDPDRRQGHHRGPRHQARERAARGPRPGQEGRDRQGQHDDHRGRGSRRRPSRRRVKQIRAQIDETTSDYDREKLQERLAKLVGGVAVIKVGAATETEMKEKKARVEDAMHATKAAVEEGIVPGGGVALLRSVPALDKLLQGKDLSPDARHGIQIISRAAEEPLRWIATNAGLEGNMVVAKVRSWQSDMGFNAATETYENLIEAGRHRPDEGRALRDPERGLDRGPAPHDGSRRGGDPGEEGRSGHAPRRRDGRLLRPSITESATDGERGRFTRLSERGVLGGAATRPPGRSMGTSRPPR